MRVHSPRSIADSATRYGILFTVLFLAPSANDAVGETTSRIEVTSDPAGYDAWLNGRYAGRTPIATAAVPGPNVLVLGRAATDSVFSAPAADTLLNVAAGETLRVLISLGRSVTILSRPFGIVVEKDGVPVGRTPLQVRIDPLTPERLELVTLDGRVPVPTDSLLSTGSWMWRGSEPPPPPSQERRSLLMRVGRYALPGFAALCIGTGAVIEKSADRAYDRYQRSADPQVIQRNYDAAHLRDSWSTVLWTAGEISLATSILSWIIPDHDQRREMQDVTR